jgi:hypothetical protein
MPRNNPRSSVTGRDTAPDARIRLAADITVTNWSMPGCGGDIS